jgi:hypothetical protein
MNDKTIIGYLYGEDTYCPACISDMFAGLSGSESPTGTTEELLDREAKRRGIDRHDPDAYSSYQFPRPIHLGDMTNGEYCVICLTPLAPPG